MLRSLRLAASGARGAWAGAIGIGVVAAAAEIGLALAFATLARVVQGEPASIAALSAWLAGAAAARVVAQVAMGHLSARAGIETTRRLRRIGLDAILRADARGREPAADALTRWMELVPRASQAQQAVIALGAQGVQAVLLAGLVIITAPALGAAMIAVLLVTAVLASVTARRVRAMARGLAASQRRVATTLERVTRHVLEIRALRTEREERDRLAHAVDEHAALQRQVAVGSALASASPIVPAVLVIAALTGYAIEAGIDPPRLVAMLYALVRLAALLAAAGHAIGVISAAGPALATLDAEPGADAPLEGARAGAKGGAAAITLSGASVELGGRRVLRDVDIAIEPGEIVALVGPSGVGKTTLLRVVLGLVDPVSGQASLDGLAPREWAAAGGRIGFVGAEPLLFAGTLRENLGYGITPPPTDATLRAALGRVSAGTLAERGLDFRIGERGEGLSTGERQRVAIARAIAGAPPVLVLDEPTSGLEAELEREIVGVVRGLAGESTVLIATHRSALQFAGHRTVELVPGNDGATIRILPGGVALEGEAR